MSESRESTRYAGPVRTDTIRVADLSLNVVRPTDPDQLLDAPDVLDWNRADDYMPYWAYLWPGAFLLAEAVGREPWVAGTDALEIGCGLGLAGLVGLARGLRVCFTDYDLAPLDFVDRSARSNRHAPGSYSTRRLDWRDLPSETYPVILGADVLYEARLVPLVANLLARMLAPGGLALIAGPYRVATESFPETLGALGLHAVAEPLQVDSQELGPIRGTLHRVTRR